MTAKGTNQPAAAAAPRFLTDSLGTYDLAAVSAIQPHHTNKNAALVLEGGTTIGTATEYETAVAAWQAYLQGESAESAPASA